MVTLTFDHRYSFEFDGSTRWDGGQVQMSINGGAWQAVPANAFSANGYVGTITGTGVLNGQPGFNDNSAGFTSGQFIRSVAVLGSFEADTRSPFGSSQPGMSAARATTSRPGRSTWCR